MARKNRIVVDGAAYHLVARVAHGAKLLGKKGLKKQIVRWLHGIADFSGITLLNWTVLDNHIHVFAEVPEVPAAYRCGDLREGACSPAWFSMRPRECNEPRWQPDVADLREGGPVEVSPAGDVLTEEAVRRAHAAGVPCVTLPRPPTGFTIPEAEWGGRLARLYDGTRRTAKAKLARWARLRAEGRGDEVQAEQDALCRRMYNVSEFMKTLKQRISQYYNREFGHKGQLWDGRFYSGVVEDDPVARTFVAAYVDWNAPKAGVVRRPDGWRWGSYAVACGTGEAAERARRGYERALGCGWPEAMARLEAIFDAKPAVGGGPARDAAHYTTRKTDGTEEAVPLSLPLLVKSGTAAARRIFGSAFFSRRRSFGEELLKGLPPRFPARTGADVLEFLETCDWSLPAIGVL